MNARKDSEPNPTKNRTTVEAKSEREIVVTRTFDAPARITRSLSPRITPWSDGATIPRGSSGETT